MDEAKREGKDMIFEGCRIAFVPSGKLSPSAIEQLGNVVQQFAGEVVGRDSKGRLPVEKATHIIANDVEFKEFSRAEELMIPVISSEWIKASLHKSRQAPLRPYSTDPRLIFTKVVLTCADIPASDKESILGAIMALGGMESRDLSKQTTHLCALSMDSELCKIAVKQHPKCKIVLPHWFDDCFKLGKRIDETPYMLPDPEVLRLGPKADVDIPSSQHLEGASSTRPNHAPLAAEQSARGELTVFKGRKLMLSWDLAITKHLRDIVQSLIGSGGGELVDDVDECDMFICQYREGEQYVRAAQQGKEVGSLSWLYHLIMHNEWTSPTRRLLHYPIPRHGLPGFEGKRLALSNYGGEARVYLENLAAACGATFTKTMKQDNTHLIAARLASEKVEAAQEWHLIIVNHLWLEESYAKCQMLPPTIPKYTHFPHRTNLGEIIGQTPFDMARVRAMFYPSDEEEEDEFADSEEEAEAVQPASTKRKRIMAEGLDNLQNDNISSSNGLKVLRDENVPNSKSTKELKKDFATPIRGRHIRSGKENDTPSVMSTGSRSAKANALNKIQDLAPDIALYEKERKRHSKDNAAPWGGKRAAAQIEKERAERAAARSSSVAREEEDDVEEAKRPAKKHKTSLPPAEMRIVLTGYQRWVGDKHKEDAERRKLRSMGIQIVQDNAACEYLAAPQMVRTKKFLVTLAKGATVIDSAFIDACLEAGEAQDPRNFILKDRENEKRLGVKLSTSVTRAKKNQGRLLWGVPIYCTADIRNGPEAYQPIAEANGAIFKIYRARGGTTIRPTTAEEDGGRDPDPVYLLTGSSPSEKQLWPKFEEMAIKGHMEPRIVITDWLLDVTMSQELSFDEKYLASER